MVTRKYIKSAWPILFGLGAMWFGDGIRETGLVPKSEFPVYPWVGLLFMGAGLPFIGHGIYLLFKAPRPELVKADFICPKCESVYPLPENAELTCPHDGTPMEPLEGYYNRHPERRDKPITENKT